MDTKIDFNAIATALQNGNDAELVNQLKTNPDLVKKMNSLTAKVKRTEGAAEKNQKLHENAEKITNVSHDVSETLADLYKEGKCRVEAVFVVEDGNTEFVLKIREKGNGTPVFINEKGEHIEKAAFLGFGRNDYETKNS